MRQNQVLQAALSAAKAGVSVVPPRQDGSKAPEGQWKKYTQRRASEDEVTRWYETPRTGLGFVCGEVSGGLTAIDFDDRAAYREYKILAGRVGLGELLERVESGYYEESPNGAHLLVRSEQCEGNQKLARNLVGKATIETRGEGGYLIVAPTYGGVNASGPYELKRGSVETIETLEPSELEELLRLARLLDQQPKVQAAEHEPLDSSEGKPGHDYNERAGWGEVLEPHGWRAIFSSGGTTHWRRPGKSRGTSATTGYGDGDYLYVFSSSCAPLEAERGYDKFGVYALLNHGGDFTAAASELALLGYGQQVAPPEDRVDLSRILATAPTKDDGFPAELLRVPGAVGELADWIVDTAAKPQPILALAASIAAMSVIIGRKAQTSTGLRSNVYVLGVGETGCGKERARQCIRRLFAEIGAPRMVGVDQIASSSAIEKSISISPASLFLIDELGKFLGQLASPRSGGHVQDINSVLLRAYSASEDVFYGKTHANPDNDVMVEQPCLSIYGTSTPTTFLEHMGGSSQSDGLFSRLLVFESQDPDPEYRSVNVEHAHTPPQGVVNAFRGWLQAPTVWDADKGDLEEVTRPRPLVASETSEAARVFEEAEREMRAMRLKMRAHGESADAYVRVVTNARKLALVRACGEIYIQSGAVPEITGDCATWACRLAEYLTGRLQSQADDHGAESEAERSVKMVRRAIKAAGAEGVVKRGITRRTHRLARRVRDECLASLIESGEVEMRPQGKTSIYIWRG